MSSSPEVNVRLFFDHVYTVYHEPPSDAPADENKKEPDVIPFGQEKAEQVSGDPAPKPFPADPQAARVSPLRNLLVAAVMRRGNVSRRTAEAAILAAEQDTGRPFLDWLANGGLEKLIELILKLLPLFA